MLAEVGCPTTPAGPIEVTRRGYGQDLHHKVDARISPPDLSALTVSVNPIRNR